jgi:hypothetical protein
MSGGPAFRVPLHGPAFQLHAALTAPNPCKTCWALVWPRMRSFSAAGYSQNSVTVPHATPLPPSKASRPAQPVEIPRGCPPLLLCCASSSEAVRDPTHQHKDHRALSGLQAHGAYIQVRLQATALATCSRCKRDVCSAVHVCWMCQPCNASL